MCVPHLQNENPIKASFNYNLCFHIGIFEISAGKQVKQRVLNEIYLS
jgi:hypothetical protein